ncbi:MULTISPECIES: methyl-accepting chemotaxis protein [Fischerella]|uniref:Chemotaxis protein n=1 Tax=Fischerella muscicola CCMEE 5323 TaxID=2019572 RepID=A0A2N6JVI9_FISMU|nr:MULTISPECIES: methyl-accepting chemotaxis protein [Fischerella]MBD2430497.1 GAF domain-containing protein [Fischerella sp. FACHB-380]PLZ83445.1 chemotaxis protein [Fischerella muscicola CCMEE 5323]
MSYPFNTTNKSKNPNSSFPLSPSQLMIDSSRVSKSSKLNITNSLQNYKYLFKWFFNLTLNRKHLIALISCELVSVLGIAFGTKLFINQSLQTQLIEQTKSELAVSDLNYHVKFNQMSSGLRSQSENVAIITALNLYNSGESLDQKLQTVIKQILKNKTQVLNVEYATLVGKDLKIIANANANRRGEDFHLSNLVKEVLKNSQSIKATRMISGSELSREYPLISNKFGKKDALIRYLITPVKDPKSKTVIGALVIGDIMNEQDAIAKETLQAFPAGYHGIYLHKSHGEFSLVGSQLQEESNNLHQSKTQIELPPESISLLSEAVAINTGTIVTKHMVLGNKTYIMAAKALPNTIVGEGDRAKVVDNTQPLAILVRGTSEASLNNLLTQSWLLQTVLVFVTFVLIGIWALILRHSITKPVYDLQQTTQKFTAGDRHIRAQVFANDEIGQLAASFNQMVDIITEELRNQENDTKFTQQLQQITTHIRRVLSSEKILNTAVSELRDFLQSDRVLFYSLNGHWQGNIIAESVADSWSKVLEENIAIPYFGEEYSDELEIGSVKIVDDIYENNFSQSYLQQLESQAVKAYLLTPVFINRKLYGLLVAHQCSHKRHWQDREINLFKQVAIQIGYALEQAELIQQIEQSHQTAQISSWEEQQHKHALQKQILELLEDVEGVVRGDLTIRVDVNEGEIGTVADFFNSIIESLRDIIIKIKVSIMQLDEVIGSNQTTIRHLTQQALTQTTEISRILDAVAQMTVAMQAVASSAQQAAQVVNTAANTATTTGKAMDTTVENILNLREIVGKTAKKVKHLGQSTQEISRVVALINEISMQTNLLAINAGIEAARMGEESQGFLVVAEEVSELAARSAQATKEIAEIVENIQQETNEVVEAMQEGVTHVAKGTQIVENAKHNLNQILDVSRQIDALVQSISTATVYGVQTSQTVSELMKQVANTSKSTSESSVQVSEYIQKTARISQKLQETVGSLKVN